MGWGQGQICGIVRVVKRGEWLTFCTLDVVVSTIGGPLHGGALAPQLPHCGREGVQPALTLAHEADVGKIGAALPEGGAQQGVGSQLEQNGVFGDGLGRGREEDPVSVAVHLNGGATNQFQY